MGFWTWASNLLFGSVNVAGDAAGGAAIGAAIGSVIPGLGTVAGAVIGGLVGGLAGSAYESYEATKRIQADEVPTATDWVIAGVGTGASIFGGVGKLAGEEAALSVRIANRVSQGATAASAARAVGGSEKSFANTQQNQHYNGYFNRVSAQSGIDPRWVASVGDYAGKSFLSAVGSKTSTLGSGASVARTAFAIQYAEQLGGGTVSFGQQQTQGYLL